jgi:hypothetical protein
VYSDVMLQRGLDPRRDRDVYCALMHVLAHNGFSIAAAIDGYSSQLMPPQSPQSLDRSHQTIVDSPALTLLDLTPVPQTSSQSALRNSTLISSVHNMRASQSQRSLASSWPHRFSPEDVHRRWVLHSCMRALRANAQLGQQRRVVFGDIVIYYF